MGLQYRYLLPDDMDDVVAAALIAREKEHFHYELNRLNYETILRGLAHLPAEWPRELREYRGLTGEQLATALAGESYALAARLQYRDRVKLLLATTEMEQGKTEAVYLALEERLPEGARREAAAERVRAKEWNRAALPEGFARMLRGCVGELASNLSSRTLRNGVVEEVARG